MPDATVEEVGFCLAPKVEGHTVVHIMKLSGAAEVAAAAVAKDQALQERLRAFAAKWHPTGKR